MRNGFGEYPGQTGNHEFGMSIPVLKVARHETGIMWKTSISPGAALIVAALFASIESGVRSMHSLGRAE
ncbi:hypothetical protein [Glutamicibacter soli]|uniref:hypothetical protein n=1 Tax=Glutamicibacter soli TaxID=453836 RepID=UPI003FCF4807